PPDDVPAWIAAADFGVYFPGYAVEGHGFLGRPIKLLEYLAIGRPVVTVEDPELAGPVREAEAGMLSPPSIESFADTILRLTADPDAMRAMGERGARYIAATYTWP